MKLVHEYVRSTVLHSTTKIVLQSTINCRPCTNFKKQKTKNKKIQTQIKFYSRGNSQIITSKSVLFYLYYYYYILVDDINSAYLSDEEAGCYSNQELEPGSATTFIDPIISGYDRLVRIYDG